MRRRFVRGAAIVGITCIVTIAIVLVVTARAFTAQPGEWSVPLRFGLFGIGPTIDASVATLARVATQPLGIAVLDGRSYASSQGMLHFTRTHDGPGDGLAIDCAPCSVRIPGLGNERIAVAALRVTITGRADRLAGAIVAGDIRGSYDARFDIHAMKLEIAFDRAPIAMWYGLFGDRIPEMRTARIDGTAAFALRVSLPDGALVVKPAIEGFAVTGLGTEALAGRMPRVACGSATRAVGPWLARAVVAAEDQRFDEHPGYDLVELVASLSRNAASDAYPHGASTIPQQLARLLYVGSERSTSRKLRELLYAVEMERTLGKARMMQLYLAIAPWGDGVCGAEAAARRYFGVTAAKLDGAQAVWLAAMLHAPDTEYGRWRARGGIDRVRAQRVVDGLRGTSRKTRARLVERLAALSPAPSATMVASGPTR